MFRKPREQANSIGGSKPSVGRPPTPPSGQFATETRVPRAVMATPPSKVLSGSKSAVPKGNKTPNSKIKAKGNTSILSFFKKADAVPDPADDDDEDNLFVTDDSPQTRAFTSNYMRPASPPIAGSSPLGVELRYNEKEASFKRRRLSVEPDIKNERNESQEFEPQRAEPLRELQSTNCQPSMNGACQEEEHNISESISRAKGSESMFKKPPPPLKREQTSISEGLFDGIEDFAEDEFPEDGEEFSERLWLQEQRALEREFEDDADDLASGVEEPFEEKPAESKGDDGECTCPICNASLAGLSSDQASLHVNRCLDGDPLPVSRPAAQTTPHVKMETTNQGSTKRFQRSTIPRPPQESPFQLGKPSLGGSAFSKIMSSHAEDIAWSTAAANEVAARGKPAFKRTCPFYKILPGFFICVDAFRYGAVEGCNAYFLSHFHSDHYIGLTASWCHGPIYCSRVTGNLVRQQLRVDPKWVVDLEFEKKREVPGTQGVEVTMIPANHCPGSSLFLFEKVVGKGPNPKMQRVLHCGDFRACPAHVQHPLLRPDVMDAVTGKKKQQKLDVCYLDTTYLTPKYAFPNQEQVIKACADMCVSLSKERVDESDSWEKMKKQRAGSGMVKFVRTEPTKASSEDGDGDGDSGEAMEGVVSTAKKESKRRGRLLVVIGTYSIGKERICLGVAKALNSKIFAPPNKLKICRALEDPELNARLTGDPLEAQVHMQMLMEIRPETLADYLTGYHPHFSRVVGFRPSGWNYRPPNSRFIESPSVQTVLRSDNWRTRYSMAELVPQRGSTREASCFGVPYSEHSSFRELTMFCCALRIDKIIPTVNVGSAKSREKMKVWMEKWAMEKKKHGLFEVKDEAQAWD